jgi:hypothetical protein
MRVGERTKLSLDKFFALLPEITLLSQVRTSREDSCGSRQAQSEVSVTWISY